MATRRIPIIALALGSVVVGACGSQPNPTTETTTQTTIEPSLTVVTSFFPLAEIATRVGIDADINVINLTPPGVNVHDHELTAKQVDSLSDADVVMYLGGGLQPSIEKAVEQLGSDIVVKDLLDDIETIEPGAKAEDSHDGHDHGDEHDHNHGDIDPHVWLDPANMITMAGIMRDTFAELAADQRDLFVANHDTYVDELAGVGDLIDASFRECDSRTIVIAHDSFAYFAKRADLTTVSISGINPDAEPSAKELEKIAEIARENQVSTVFFETAIPDALARTVASTIGADVDVLDPMGAVSRADVDAGKDYVGIHTDNIARIAAALGCA